MNINQLNEVNSITLNSQVESFLDDINIKNLQQKSALITTHNQGQKPTFDNNQEYSSLIEEINNIKQKFEKKRSNILAKKEIDRYKLLPIEWKQKYQNLSNLDLILPLKREEAEKILNLKITTLKNSKQVNPYIVEELLNDTEIYQCGRFIKLAKIKREDIIEIVKKLPKYSNSQLQQALERLYYQTNTYGKPIKCLDYYFQELFRYPAYLLDRVFNYKFHNFPSLQAMHCVITNNNSLAKAIYDVYFL